MDRERYKKGYRSVVETVSRLTSARKIDARRIGWRLGTDSAVAAMLLPVLDNVLVYKMYVSPWCSVVTEPRGSLEVEVVRLRSDDPGHTRRSADVRGGRHSLDVRDMNALRCVRRRAQPRIIC